MLIDTLKASYLDVSGQADRMRSVVEEQLSELLRLNAISLGVPMESRVKSWNSIAEKLERRQLQLECITELQDLIGLRAILLFRSDLDKVSSLIRTNFEVVSSEDTADRLNETQFGYQSQHFIVRLQESWLRLPTMSGLGQFKVELQLRTLSQHIWAAASHKLQYKNEAGIPPPLRRSIHRVSALLETVDLEFERLLEERRNYIEFGVGDAMDKELLNVDSLAATLRQFFPKENLADEEDYADLLRDLIEFKITTVQDLKKLINRHRTAIFEAEAAMLAGRVIAIPDSDNDLRISKGIFFTHVGLARQALFEEFGKDRLVDFWISQENR